MKITLLLSCFFLFINSSIASDKNLGYFYYLTDSIANHYDNSASFLKSTSIFKHQILKQYSIKEGTVFDCYLSFNIYDKKNELDSAHIFLLKALSVIDKYELKNESIIYILKSLATINIQVNNPKVGFEYIQKIKDLIQVYKPAKEAYINTLFIYAYQQADTILLTEAHEKQVEYYSKTVDTLSFWYAQSSLFRLKKDYDSSIFFLNKKLEEEEEDLNNSTVVILYDLVQTYQLKGDQESVIKYTELFIPYIDESPAFIKENILKLLINQKIANGDTTNLMKLQAKYLSTKNPLADGVIISNIVKSEIEHLKLNQKKESNLYTYVITSIFFFSLVFFISRFIRKKDDKPIKDLINQSPKISLAKEEEIKRSIELFISEKRFLNPSASQTKIVEDFNLGNIKYLSKIIKKEYGKKFPVFIKELRVDYLKENYNSEFKNLNKSEIADKLGFGSYRTFKDHIEKSHDTSITDFINNLKV